MAGGGQVAPVGSAGRRWNDLGAHCPSSSDVAPQGARAQGARAPRATLVRLSTGISGDRLALLGIAWKYTSPATNIFVIDVFSKLFLSQRLLPRGSHSIAISKYSQLRNHQPLGNCHQSRGNLGNDEYTHFCICR